MIRDGAFEDGSMKMMGTINILRNDRLAIHSYFCPEDGEMVCSQVIETPNKLVIVDAQQLRPYAQELRRYVERLNKPIDRIIVTHSHPDHWMGLEFFQDVPIYALQETRDEIDEIGDYLIKLKQSEVGDLAASCKVLPTHILTEGSNEIDGLRYEFIKVLDSEISFLLAIEIPESKLLLAQDLVYNHVYLCVGEMNDKKQYLFDGWIRALEYLQAKEYDIILPGHGEPTNATIFPEMIKYIQYAKELFESGIGEAELKQCLIKRYPDYRVTQLLDISNIFLYHRTW
jgi:glyoxylase-like metal-dependent hydrolase (beta-lactamase superfamily II)